MTSIHRDQLAAPGDLPTQHLGEAETIAIVARRQLRCFFVTSDGGAARLAAANGIQVVDTWHLLKIAHRKAWLDADILWGYVLTIEGQGRGAPRCLESRILRQVAVNKVGLQVSTALALVRSLALLARGGHAQECLGTRPGWLSDGILLSFARRRPSSQRVSPRADCGAVRIATEERAHRQPDNTGRTTSPTEDAALTYIAAITRLSFRIQPN
jgi:hypothetical protein